MLQDVEAGAFEEGGELAHVPPTPRAAQAGGVAEYGIARFAGLGVNGVVLGADGTARQQGVSTQLDSLVVGVVSQLAKLIEIGRVLTLRVEATAEGEDDHLETDIGALVNGQAHGIGIGVPHVHEDGVLGDPGCDGSVHAAHGQAAALAIGAVVDEHKGAEGLEDVAGSHIEIRTEGGAALK